jgi:hypothetical protein
MIIESYLRKNILSGLMLKSIAELPRHGVISAKIKRLGTTSWLTKIKSGMIKRSTLITKR